MILVFIYLERKAIKKVKHFLKKHYSGQDESILLFKRNPSWFTGDQGDIVPSWVSITENPKIPRDGGTGDLVVEGGDPDDSFALKTHKWGPSESNIEYSISDLESGSWDCTLHFAETSGDWNIPGKRVFNAEISTSQRR